MTGRDLILYILSNGLEDEPIMKDGRHVGFMTVPEAASKMNVGDATILMWIFQKQLDYVSIGDNIFIPVTVKSPLEDNLIKEKNNE